MKKYNRNKKRNSIIIISVVIVVGIVSIVSLIKSHAYFETRKSFDVLKGRVPNFVKGDIKFAFVVDGVEEKTLPKKDSGYHFVGSECTSGAKASWNELSWSVSVSNLSENGTSCTLKFEKKELNFDYGDGSLNTVSRSCELNGYVCTNLSETIGGYVDKVYIYDYETGIDTKLNSDVQFYTGNLNMDISLKNLSGITTPLNPLIDSSSITVQSGDNELTVNNISSINSIIMLYFWYGNVRECGISNLKLNIDSNYYTLKEAVNTKKIKPLVIMDSWGYGSNWLGNNVANLYDGGTYKAGYPLLKVYFMLEQNSVLKSIKFSSAYTITSGGGWFNAYKADNQILHL